MIRITVAMMPHIQKGKPTGYYLFAERLFNKPVELGRRQFAGYSDGLILTVGGLEHLGWDTTLHMAINLPVLGGKPVTWLTGVAQYKSPGGFKTYLPGKQLLMPTSAEEGTTHIYGEFMDVPVGDDRLYFLKVPLLNGDVMLGRKKLHDIGRK